MSYNQNTYNSKKTLQSLLMVMALFAILFFSSSLSLSSGSVFAADEKSKDGDTKTKSTATDSDHKDKTKDKDTKDKDNNSNKDKEKGDTKTKSTATDDSDKDSSDDNKGTKTKDDEDGKKLEGQQTPEEHLKPPGEQSLTPSSDSEGEKDKSTPDSDSKDKDKEKDTKTNDENSYTIKSTSKGAKTNSTSTPAPKENDKPKDDNKTKNDGDNNNGTLDFNDRNHRRPDGSYRSGSYCPGDFTQHCWDSGADFAKYLAKDMRNHCGEVTNKYFRGLEEVPYVIKAYPSMFRNLDHCNHDHNVKVDNNNKIDITTKYINKYTTKTNIITGPLLAQQRLNGSYQGTLNDRFIEFTDMPATSPVIFPVATTKTRNVLEPNAIDVSGQLKNIGTGQAKFISMIATVYNKFNQTLALENASPQPNSILPGQSVPFKFSIGVNDGLVNRTQDVAFVKYHWTWFDENGKQY